MSFRSPHFLWLFLLVLGSGPWAIRGQRLRARSWRLLAERGKVPNLLSLSILLAAVFLILALARPRFGSIIGPPLPPGHDVALLIDVSRSMGAEDAVPNRLAVAIDAAESLVSALAPDPANRVALVVFAGRGVIWYPLTENLGAVVDVLHRLRPGSVRPGGTDLGAGLDAALETLGQEEHAAGRSIVVFSDGEDLADHWRSRLDRLVRAEVIVHVVAIGDPEQGHPVPSGTGDQPLSYQGKKVLSRRVDTALEAIAQETDGAVLKLGLAAADLKTLYRTRIAPVAQRKRAAGRFADARSGFRCSWLPRWGWHSRDAGRADASAPGAGSGAELREPYCSGAWRWRESGQGKVREMAACHQIPERPEPRPSPIQRRQAFLQGHRRPRWWPGVNRLTLPGISRKRCRSSNWRSSGHRASRFPGTTPPRPCSSSSVTKRPTSAIKRPATEQELRCARRSIMLWAIRRWRGRCRRRGRAL